MNIRSRLKALEDAELIDVPDEPILIRVKNCSLSDEPIPVDSFDLSVGSVSKVINREKDEVEEVFLDRVLKIGREHIVKPKDRNDVTPAVILFQRVDYAKIPRSRATAGR